MFQLDLSNLYELRNHARLVRLIGEFSAIKRVRQSAEILYKNISFTPTHTQTYMSKI